MTYRVYVGDTPAAPVFAIAASGFGVAFEIAVLVGRIVLVPPVSTRTEDRVAIAGTLFECFERLDARRPQQPPEWIRKEAQ